MTIADLFAGFGWSEGLRTLGLADVGLELNRDACATRARNGHATIRCDLTTYRPPSKVEGLIASPPCQDFSVAGKQAGRTGERGELIDLVPVWVEATQPEWVACEQVPPCLDIWREHAELYRTWGYSVWTGILNSADHGVPQTRKRAFLIASRTGVAHPPAPTHARDPQPTMFGLTLPWVTMAKALGWAGGGDAWCWRMPATTIAGDPRITARCHHEDGSQGAGAKSTAQVQAGDYAGTEPIKLTVAEALTLQGFRPDFELVGSRSSQFLQIGNSVPPPMAAAVLGQLLDRKAVAA